MSVPVLKFGMHRGRNIQLVPQRYLDWLAKQDLDVETREIVDDELFRRETSGEAPWHRMCALLDEYRHRAWSAFGWDEGDYWGRAMLWDFSCWVCGGPWEAADHVIPALHFTRRLKQRPRLNSPANFRPICHRCNSRKGARPAASVKPSGIFSGVKSERITDTWNLLARRADVSRAQVIIPDEYLPWWCTDDGLKWVKAARAMVSRSNTATDGASK